MNVYIWPFLVQKRLLKKISLLLMFIILASVTVIFRVTSNYKGGIISCALFLEDDDITAGKISSELMESDFIRFIKCSSKEDALSCVKNNRASCAWIFKSGMTETLKKSALNKKIQPIVEVYEKEDDALLSFCREILCAALYKAFSYEAYSSYVRSDAGYGFISDSELKSVYGFYVQDNNIFETRVLLKKDAFKIFPLRGILALWLMLCSFTAAFYSLKDQKSGVFSVLNRNKKNLLSVLQSITILIDAAVLFLLSVKAGGIYSALFNELFNLLLFVISSFLFCEILKNIFSSYSMFAVFIPVMLIAMCVFTPVFINLSTCIQYIFPPYWYLNAVCNIQFIKGEVLYILILSFVLLVNHVTRK